MDSPIKKDDHSLDELRYYIMHIQNNNSEKIKSSLQKEKEKLIKSLKRKQYE